MLTLAGVSEIVVEIKTKYRRNETNAFLVSSEFNLEGCLARLTSVKHWATTARVIREIVSMYSSTTRWAEM